MISRQISQFLYLINKMTGKVYRSLNNNICIKRTIFEVQLQFYYLFIFIQYKKLIFHILIY